MNEIRLDRGLKLRKLKKQMSELLQSFGIDSSEANVEAELIVEHVSGMNRSQQIVCADIPITDRQTGRIEKIIVSRKDRMPIQYCLETADFAGFKFKIKPGVFIPRTDTEILLERALKICQSFDSDRKVINVLEVGVGSGALAVSLLKKNTRVILTGTDISEEALALTLENAKHHEVINRLSLKNEGLWWVLENQFDLIICNPPYIPLDEKEKLEPEVVDYEPHTALFGRDPDGLRFYRKLSTSCEKLFGLAGGYIAMEVGDRQAAKVVEIFRDSGWKKIASEKDVNGIYRVVSGFWGS